MPVLRYHAACRHHGPRPNSSALQDDGTHTDDRSVLDTTTLEQCCVPDHHVRTHHCRHIKGCVDNAIVLNRGPGANANRRQIAAKHRTEPNRRTIADLDIAQQHSRRGDIDIRTPSRPLPRKRLNDARGFVTGHGDSGPEPYEVSASRLGRPRYQSVIKVSIQVVLGKNLTPNLTGTGRPAGDCPRATRKVPRAIDSWSLHPYGRCCDERYDVCVTSMNSAEFADASRRPDLAADWRDHLDAEEQVLFEEAFQATLKVREELDRLPDPSPPMPCRPPNGRRPREADNPCNAWVWRCSIQGSPDGSLHGRSVALKDVVAVAGVPLTGGSHALEGYVPERDATIVTRILSAGATITGIATTEDMSFSGVSITAAQGAVRNPCDESRSAGGSSSGVAALIALRAADLGVGADQGGSIRLPASLCGVFGLKPTFGLVPYTGCIPIDPSIDHLGPMANSAADTALLLDAIAGDDDGRDPRQRHAPRAYSSSSALDGGVSGLRIGVLVEGFEPDIDERVGEEVRQAACRFAELGAVVEDVSIPEHRWALPVHTAIILQGAAQHMLRGLGLGVVGKGYYDGRLAGALSRGLMRRGDSLAPGVKLAGAVGSHLWDAHQGAYYAKAQNLARTMASRYDSALKRHDLLLLPTTLVTAQRFPKPGLDPLAAFLDGSDARLVSNTCSFNQTGHPALTMPIGPPDALPVGLTLVARHLEDHLALRAAHAFERAGLTRRALPSR